MTKVINLVDFLNAEKRIKEEARIKRRDATLHGYDIKMVERDIECLEFEYNCYIEIRDNATNIADKFAANGLAREVLKRIEETKQRLAAM